MQHYQEYFPITTSSQNAGDRHYIKHKNRKFKLPLISCHKKLSLRQERKSYALLLWSILVSFSNFVQVRVLWAGLYSDYYTALNGVKQGGVISPVLFCIYIDNLLIKLSLSGVGCFIGLNFVGALAYADDIVILAPTPSALRKMLSICDSFAADYDILFNPDKSKFLVIAANKRRGFYKEMRECEFYISGRIIENVEQYSHLGHIITSSFHDNEDITHRRNCFVGQANNVLCFFSKLDPLVKLNLFKSYCSSMYGCELWALNNPSVESFCIAWRKALRRIFYLPNNTHSFFLPILSDSIPIFDEICKRTARFISSCLFSPSRLVQSISWFSLVFGRFGSPLGTNALICCKRYNWLFDEFILNLVNLGNNLFRDWYVNRVSDIEFNNAASLLEILFIRDGHFKFSHDFTLNKSEINDIIKAIATA